MEKKEKPKKKRNPNHPKKGSEISVQPIRDDEDIKKIKEYLKDHPRNHLLFVLGINNGIRAGDLLKLKIKHLRYRRVGEYHQITESKTGKKNIVIVNKAIRKALDIFIESRSKNSPDLVDAMDMPIIDQEFLFKSTKGQNKPITINHVNKLIKKWTSHFNIRGNFGSHTLRKTWGYHQRVKFGTGFEILCKRYNHSSPAVTMRYLGIEDKEVHKILMNEIC